MLDYKERNLGPLAYVEGGKVTLDLPTDLALHSLKMKLAGRANISGGSSSGTPWPENPMTLIERVRVYGSKPGGSVEIINHDAATLYELAHILEEVAATKNAIAGGGVAKTDFNADILVPLSLFGKKIGQKWKAMSLLPAWVFSELKLEIQFRKGTQVTDGGLISGGDRTIALTQYGADTGTPSVNIVAVQVENIDKNRHKPMLMKLYKTTEVTESTESAHRVKLNRGNYYRGFLVKVYNDTDERPLSDSVLSNVQIMIDNTPKNDWPFDQLKDANKKDFSLESLETGYGIIDYCKGGDMKTALDTRGYSAKGTVLEAVLNVAGVSGDRVDVTSIEVLDAGW